MARTGMILIREVADAPVIMGISKPAGLKSQRRGGKIVNQLFVGIDVGSQNNAVYLMRPDGEKHSSFRMQNNRGGAKLLTERIVSAIQVQSLEGVVIGTEATSIYGDSLVYACARTESWDSTPGKSMCSIPNRSTNSKSPTPNCPRTIMWMPL